MHTYIHVCLNIYVYVSMCVNMYIYTHIQNTQKMHAHTWKTFSVWRLGARDVPSLFWVLVCLSPLLYTQPLQRLQITSYLWQTQLCHRDDTGGLLFSVDLVMWKQSRHGFNGTASSDRWKLEEGWLPFPYHTGANDAGCTPFLDGEVHRCLSCGVHMTWINLTFWKHVSGGREVIQHSRACLSFMFSGQKLRELSVLRTFIFNNTLKIKDNYIIFSLLFLPQPLRCSLSNS